MKFGAIVALAVLSLACPTAAQAAWSGWARCEVEIMGEGYTNSETHDWVVTNAPQNTLVTGTWVVAGSGELSTTAQLSRWRISAVRTTEFKLEVFGGQVTIKRMSEPYGSGAIEGYTFPATNPIIRALQLQWQFPRVTGPIGQTEIRNLLPSSTGFNPLRHGWGRPHVSTLTDKCTWWFKDGSVPDSPTPVIPPPVPVPPQTPIAGGVEIYGTTVVGNELIGVYNYHDAQNDREGTSTLRWLRDSVAISGQTAKRYTLLNADVGKMVSFEVTPVARSGPSPGSPVKSSQVGPVTVWYWPVIIIIRWLCFVFPC